ncbi:MAG: Gfo/Idh/MocA family oxidoreductase [Candidatus Thorarchaeota archaeon]
MKPVEMIVIGAGDRGNVYASYAKKYPEITQIVGVAEPREFYRQRMTEEYDIPIENVYTDWKDITKQERFADAVIIATQDSMHVEPAVAFANLGYHILLEKPMAPDAEGCKKIVQAVMDNNTIFSVGHVLRYTNYTMKLKEIIDSGAIGNIVSIDRLEPVGFWHQAHSFVRGNWRNEAESASMLLAKSCHDIDWIRYIMGKKCTAISSFGSLVHFKKENKPENAGSRCLQCDYEPNCPYSAKRIYFEIFRRGYRGWPVSVITSDVTEKGILNALETGPYGRCVYECDNDVVDHQVVNMEFEGGESASFTMTAFTQGRARETRIFGTKGELIGNGTKLHVYDFLTDETEIIDTTVSEGLNLEGHGGGDYGLIKAFVKAVSEKNPELILSGPEETLQSHLMVFAAEQSRLTKKTISL